MKMLVSWLDHLNCLFRMPIVWYSNAVMFEQEEADEGTVMLVAPAPLMALQTPSALFH